MGYLIIALAIVCLAVGFIGAFALAIHASSVFGWIKTQVDKRL